MATTRKSKSTTEPVAYVALTRIEHNDEIYLPGDPITLTDDQAEPLLAVGAIQKSDAA